MGEIYEARPVQDTLDGFWRGTIAKGAATMTDTVMVRIRSFDDTHQFGPAKWMARDSTAKPVRGNECLVVFDDGSRPVVIAWWP